MCCELGNSILAHFFWLHLHIWRILRFCGNSHEGGSAMKKVGTQSILNANTPFQRFLHLHIPFGKTISARTMDWSLILFMGPAQITYFYEFWYVNTHQSFTGTILISFVLWLARNINIDYPFFHLFKYGLLQCAFFVISHPALCLCICVLRSIVWISWNVSFFHNAVVLRWITLLQNLPHMSHNMSHNI